MRHRHLLYGGFVLLVLFPLGTGGEGGHARASADSKPQASSPQSMKGEVVMLSGEVCVVKDSTGKSVLFRIDKGTRIDGSVKEGKTVEVSASVDGRALSIKESS
jgi:hypothetical protein